MTEDEMVRWPHGLNGHEFEQTLGDSGEGNGTPLQYSCLGKSHGRRSLVGCSPLSCEESDTTERLHFHFTFMHQRRKWQPTPVFLPGESQGRQSLVGCYLWGCTEQDTTEATQQQQHIYIIYINIHNLYIYNILMEVFCQNQGLVRMFFLQKKDAHYSNGTVIV